MDDPQEIKEILDVVSEKVPKLLEEITDALFSPEKAEKFGETVAKFYKAMIDSGMSPDQAFELTQKFMDSSSPGGMITQALGGLSGGGGPVHKEVHIHGHNGDLDDDEISKKIERKVQQKFDRKSENE